MLYISYFFHFLYIDIWHNFQSIPSILEDRYSSHNIDYEFKIKNGILRDKFFLGAFLMLFRRREEYFQNLILDIEHIKENINAGFCGFTFFINGEWKSITIDTRFIT